MLPRPSELIAMLLPFHQAYEVSCRARTKKCPTCAIPTTARYAPVTALRNAGSPALSLTCYWNTPGNFGRQVINNGRLRFAV